MVGSGILLLLLFYSFSLGFYSSTLVTCMVYCITHPPSPDYITTLSKITCMRRNMCCAIFWLHNHPLYGHVYDGFWDFTPPSLTLVTCMVYFITHPIIIKGANKRQIDLYLLFIIILTKRMTH